MKPSQLPGLVVFLASALALGQTLPGKPPTAPRPVAVAQILISDDAPETRATVARLCGMVERFDANQATLRQVTDGLRNALGVNLVVMWADLQAAGVKQKTPVSFSLTQVSGDQLLRTTMALAAPGQLDYLVSDGVVEICTRAWLEKRKFPRSYTGKVLIEKGFYTDTQPEERAAALVALCRRMATPEVWSQAGNVCKFAGGDMVVAAPMRSHYELSDLFSDLYHPVRVSPDRPAKVEVPAWLAPTRGWEEAAKRLAAATGLTAEDQPLSAVYERARAGGLRNLVVDWTSLAKIGATPQTRVTYHAANPPAALGQVLCELTGFPQGAAAVACGVEGVVTVTVPSAVEEDQRLGVYDLRDVVRRRIFENPRQKPTQREVMTQILAALEKAGFPFKAAAETQPAGVAAAARNGTAGVFMEYEGLLVVRAAPEVHRNLAQSLGSLVR